MPGPAVVAAVHVGAVIAKPASWPCALQPIGPTVAPSTDRTSPARTVMERRATDTVVMALPLPP